MQCYCGSECCGTTAVLIACVSHLDHVSPGAPLLHGKCTAMACHPCAESKRTYADDADLAHWRKVDHPFIPLPPASMGLTGWRDPFVIQRGVDNKDWIMLMGAGIKDKGGTTLIYRAQALDGDWAFTGTLCQGDPAHGAMWECPLLWRIPGAPDPLHAPEGVLGRQLPDPFAPAAQRGLQAVHGGSDVFAEPAHWLQVRDPAASAELMGRCCPLQCAGGHLACALRCAEVWKCIGCSCLGE